MSARPIVIDMKKILSIILLSCLTLGAVPMAKAEEAQGEEATCLIKQRKQLISVWKKLEEKLIEFPDNEELKAEIERIRNKNDQINENLMRMSSELTELMKKLEGLREKQAQFPDDQELKKETERVNTEYRHKIRQYNALRIPRSKLIFEGDLPPENMPWERTDGGKVSVSIRRRGEDITTSDEEAEVIRLFLNDHVSEWIRGDQITTEGRIDQVIIAGSMTISKENGYSRTYTFVDGDGLTWNGCYLPMNRTYSDRRCYDILRRYFKDLSKLPPDREAIKLHNEQMGTDD